ncbi:MAG: hypothetical protein ACRDL8_19620, partial [Solirubrobacteraceae bacterium]
MTSSLGDQARVEAAAALEAAREEGEAVIERAREHGRAMLDQAQEARRRVLADMAYRRRLVTEQIELFRKARDEIATSVIGVRRSLDKIVEDLSQAEDSARAAATAGPHTPDVPEQTLVAEGERTVAELDASGDGARGAMHASRARHPTARPAGTAVPGSAGGVQSRLPGALLRFDDVATVVDEPGASARGSNGSDLAEIEPPVVVVRPASGTSAGDHAVSGASSGAVHDWQDDPTLAGASELQGLVARLRAATRAAPDATQVSEAAAATTQEQKELEELEERNAGKGMAADRGPGSDTEEEPEGETEGEASSADPPPDLLAFTRRAEALDPIVAALARRMKRFLQD